MEKPYAAANESIGYTTWSFRNSSVTYSVYTSEIDDNR